MSDRGAGDVIAADVVITGEDWLDAICPFLRARDGTWRSASPAREHRCWAAEPPSELPVLTQQRLCLVRAHDKCERFLHARELRSAGLARERLVPGAGSSDIGVRASGHIRREGGWREALEARIARLAARPRRVVVGAMVLVGVVIGSILFAGGGTGEPVRSPGASSLAPVASVFEAEGTVGPDGVRWYRVRAGDTLRTIADRFGITVRELRSANELGDPPRLEPGDVILVPVPR